mgnify:FL=1
MYEGTNALLEGMSASRYGSREVTFWDIEFLITGKCKTEGMREKTAKFCNYTYI